MNVYSASVALLWTTAMRATTPTSRPPRAARDAAGLHLLRSTRGALAPLAAAPRTVGAPPRALFAANLRHRRGSWSVTGCILPTDELVEIARFTVGHLVLDNERELALIEYPEPLIPGNRFQGSLA